jgi:flavin-dependent dehydrogenase
VRGTDVAIIGGDPAGSTCAATPGRAGADTILIDPHDIFREDFHCLATEESLAAPGTVDGACERLSLRQAVGTYF